MRRVYRKFRRASRLTETQCKGKIATVLPRFLSLPILVACTLLLEGCPSVGVHQTSALPLAGGSVGEADGAARHPRVVYVANFDFERCILNVDREGAERLAFKEDLARSLNADIVERIGNLGVSAQSLRAPLSADASPQAAWLVTGHFTRVNQGSRTLRVLVGVGSGGTKMETRVALFDLSVSSIRPIATFTTSGGSGAAPGAMFSTNPYTAVAGAAVSATAGLSADRHRTARMIVAYLSQALASHGWLEGAMVKDVKRLDAEDAKKLEGDAADASAFTSEEEARRGSFAPTSKRPGARGK